MSRHHSNLKPELSASVAERLSVEERDVLGSILHTAVVKHRQLARLDETVGRITKDELEWHLGHADFIEGIGKKLGVLG